MDFHGNVRVEQRARSEESRPDTAMDGAEKIRLVENAKGSDREIDQRRESDPLKNLSMQNFVGNEQHRAACPQGENYGKMSERDRDEGYEGSFSVANPTHFDGGHVWERKIVDQRYDNYGNADPATGSDRKGIRVPYRNCKSGINISVVSRGQPKVEGNEVEKPMYSVSFKCCYDNQSPKWDNKRKKLIPAIGGQSKKFKVRDGRNENVLSIRQVTDDCANNQGNYRCTFENCCGNCESYIVEIPNNDCNAYSNWQNNDFETGNACLEDCCCPREMKVYSSNLSVVPRASCGASVDGRKCCSAPTEPKCDFVADDRGTISKQCLQRVHFAKNDGRPKRNHSSCSFCSRKCTPSKASLFVQIDESVTDVCGLSSAQTFQHADSMESFKDYDYGAVENDGFDLSRGKSTKRIDPTCNPRCTGRQGAVGRSLSDRFPHMDSRVDDGAVGQNALCREMLRNTRSNENLQEAPDCRAQKESNMSMTKKTADYNQQCDTDERSLWGDIRRGKVWTQLQDTYKSFVKVASTGIGQIVKQSSKLKRSKKSAKDRLTCATSTKEYEENVSSSDQCNQSDTCDDCLHEATCWNEIMTREQTDCDMHCCRSFYCDNIANLPECRQTMCQNDREGNAQGEITSRGNWRFDARDNVRWNAYAPYRESCKDLKSSKHRTHRKRGGGDHSNQKRKTSNSNKQHGQNSGEKPSTSGNGKSQVTKRQAQPLTNSNQQTEGNVMHIDVSVQSNTLQAIIDPPDSSYVAESMEYRRRVATVSQYEARSNQPTEYSYSDSDSPVVVRDTPVIQEIDSTLHPLAPAPKRPQAQPRRCITPGTQPGRCGVQPTATTSRGTKQEPVCRPMASSMRKDPCTLRERPMAKQVKPSTPPPTKGKGVQCTVARELRLICGPERQKETVTRVNRLCLCHPKTPAEQKDAPRAKPGVSKAAPPVESVEKDADAVAAGTAGEEVPGAQDGQARQAEPVVEDATEVIPVVEEATEDTPVVKDATEAIPVIEEAPEQVTEPVDVGVVEPESKDSAEQAPEERDQTDKEGVTETAAATGEVTEGAADSAETKEGTAVEDALNVTAISGGTAEPAEPDAADKTREEISRDVTPMSPLTSPVPDSPTDVDQPDSRAPIEISKEFNGKRTHVSVQMQTSSTILTKILSEFKVGNKKQQVLMSIKLQTNMDEDEDTGSQRPMSNDSPPDQQRRTRWRSRTRSAQYRPMRERTNTVNSGYLEDQSSSYGLDDSPSPPTSRYNSCSGPCGKKKLG